MSKTTWCLALDDWNKLSGTGKYTVPRKGTPEYAQLKQIMDSYRMKGSGLDTAVKVGQIGQKVIGAIKDPLSAIANAGLNLVDWSNQIQQTEQAQRDVQSAAQQQVREHAAKSLPKTRQEAIGQHTFSEILSNPTKGLKGAKFKALKAEAIRQLQAEGKTPRQVEDMYHQRIQELQQKNQPVALNITPSVAAEWTPENQAEYDYYQQAKQDLAQQHQELTSKNPIQVALGFGHHPPSPYKVYYDMLVEKALKEGWTGYETQIVIEHITKDDAVREGIKEEFHAHGYKLHSPHPLRGSRPRRR